MGEEGAMEYTIAITLVFITLGFLSKEKEMTNQYSA